MANEVEYVSFGGTQVPANLQRKVINQNGKQMYCIWLKDKDEEGKIIYPEQQTKPSNESVYTKTWYTRLGITAKPKVYSEPCSESAFESAKDMAEYDREHPSQTRKDIFIHTSKDGRSSRVETYLDYGTSTNYKKYEKQPLDTTPRIEIETDDGIIYDTRNITISNLDGATVVGTDDEDNITLKHTNNCTVDVSNANNNIFVSDNVRVINGKGNKIKLGDNDTLEKVQHNYKTNTEASSMYEK